MSSKCKLNSYYVNVGLFQSRLDLVVLNLRYAQLYSLGYHTTFWDHLPLKRAHTATSNIGPVLTWFLYWNFWTAFWHSKKEHFSKKKRPATIPTVEVSISVTCFFFNGTTCWATTPRLRTYKAAKESCEKTPCTYPHPVWPPGQA